MDKTPPETVLPPLSAQDTCLQGPRLCGDIDMRIAADGVWHYGGSPIARKELVTLFSRCLYREGDAYWLITPAEKARIQVDDAPFLGVELSLSRTATLPLTIRTNVDDIVTVDEDHPLHMENGVPYVTVRDGLDAKLTRAVYYELVAEGTTEAIDGNTLFGIWSANVFFPLGTLDAEGDASS